MTEPRAAEVNEQEQATLPARPVSSSENWGRALLMAAAILALAYLGFLVVPNRLVAFLATRVGPNVRDGVVTGWVTVFFLAMSWIFVALQSRRERG